MKTLVLNGSPHPKGTVATLLHHVIKNMKNSETDWINVYNLKMQPCRGCMKCRDTEKCVLPEDDAVAVGVKIMEADNLIIGTPTHWGNMSSPLKMLFDRNVFTFMKKSDNTLPVPKQKGKKAVVVTACNTPFPANFILAESRGAVQSVKKILKYGGYRTAGTIVKPGTKPNQQKINRRYLAKAEKIGKKLV